MESEEEMRKVKCITSMPFLTIGDELEIDEEGYMNGSNCPGLYDGTRPEQFIEDSWMIWVEEEKSLEDKLEDYIVEGGVGFSSGQIEEFILIARKHENKRYIKIAKERFKHKEYCFGKDEMYIISEIVKAIEGGIEE